MTKQEAIDFCKKTKYKDTVKIIDFEATMNKDDLILKGKCENCSSSVARLIEG